MDSTLVSNFIYAARTLRKNAAFSLTIIVVLALGIGGSVGIFSIVNAVLVRPMPYEYPDRLVLLIGNVQRATLERRGGSFLDYRDWKVQSRSFDGMAAYWNTTFTLRGREDRVAVRGEVVGAQYLRLLGMKPILGRDFCAEEETDAALPPVVILGHDFWTQRLGSNPSVLGTQLTFNAATYTIVGVLPKGFRGVGDQAEVWVPPASLPRNQQSFTDRGTRGLNVLGRLREGVDRVQAQAEIDRISQSLEKAYPDTNQKRGAEVSPLVQETFGNVRPALLALQTAVSIVLLIACANVANLMLLRTETRHAEIALRAAVGASRGELLKLVLSETMLLSFVGAACGLLLSGWAVDLVLAVSPIQLPSFVSVTMDRNVIFFAVGLACFTGIFMGILPALQLAPANLHEVLSANSAKTTGAPSSRRIRYGLVVAEVALSFGLLLSAGLLIESFRQLLRVDPGFQTSRLLTLRVAFDSGTSVNRYAVRDALQGLPGIKSVALTSVVPFTGGPAIFYSAEGDTSPVDATNNPRTYLNFVSAGFFRTMGIPLVHGRDFNPGEGMDSVIVSEKVVQRFWPGQDPIGKRIKNGGRNAQNPWLNIIGVVANTKTRGLPDNPTADPDIYLPFELYGGVTGVLIRTELPPSNMIPAVRNEIGRLDKLAIVSNVATVEELMQPLTARSRFLSGVSGIFSGMALLLALLGIYGSMSYTVAQRTREIGIRIAVGASHLDVFKMVLGRSLALVGAGLGLGVIGGFFASRGLSTLLIGISATAPSVFILASALMIITGLGAACLPAHRAARIDPLRALREE